MIKGLIYLFMVGMVISLGFGLYFMLTQKKPERLSQALMVRVGFAVAILVLLFVAIALGWLKPHGLLL